MPLPQLISFDPYPPQKGKQLVICFDFSGTGATQTTLEVTLWPGPTTKDYDVTADSPCVTIDIPANATQILVRDLLGMSKDNGSMI